MNLNPFAKSNKTAVTKEDFDKIMQEEKFACKNPVLFKNISEDANAFDRALPAKAAEALGKCLQGLMKTRKEEQLTEKTLEDGIKAIDAFDSNNNDALRFSYEHTIKILAATWEKGEQVAECLGASKESYQKFCRSMNKEFVENVSQTSNKVRE